MNTDSRFIERFISQRVRPDVRAMHGYHVAPSAGLIKLDAMENPHRLSPSLQAALGRRLGQVAVNRYPAARIQTLKDALSSYAKCPPGYRILLGNGSDEIISLLALVCQARSKEPSSPSYVLAPEPGFVMYKLSAQIQGLAYQGVSLRADFELDEPAMLRAMAQYRPAITYLAYPNNPSANLWDRATMHRIIEAAAKIDGLVVVDEAYQPFAQQSFAPHLEQHPNLLIMRTLSKFGLAGIRLGYMLGPAALIDEIDKVRPPYNVNELSAECALFALEHEAVFVEQAAAICAQREYLLQALASLPGLTCYPSQANMILIRVPDASRVFRSMREQGVLIKNMHGQHPLLDQCLRLTVGTESENQVMLAALTQALNA